MKVGKFAYLLVASLLLLAACAGPANDVPGITPVTPGTNGTPDATVAMAVLEAQQYLSEQLGVTLGEVEILDTEEVEWPDACLGLPDQDEACAQVVTPGWRVMFEVQGQIYELRTDETGSVVRAVEDLEGSGTTE
jgi:hypothetical protein